jgi:hypothetical protein
LFVFGANLFKIKKSADKNQCRASKTAEFYAHSTFTKMGSKGCPQKRYGQKTNQIWNCSYFALFLMFSAYNFFEHFLNHWLENVAKFYATDFHHRPIVCCWVLESHQQQANTLWSLGNYTLHKYD